MDLQDFECNSMYFDEGLSVEVESLIKRASDEYGSYLAEEHLLKAYFLAPKNLTVLVALYRYYYYQHDYSKALKVAERAMQAASEKLDITADWRQLNEAYLGVAAQISMGLLRFYLLSLKGAAYLSLRLDRIDDGIEMLEKLCQLDPHDRLHVKFLLEMAQEKANITDNENVYSIRGYSQFRSAGK